ncbi:neural proliferation differentiation and control protein 1a [Echeneis naucrates]|uniref:Neural proliferation differentiation and control protein 1-like n=1 Tax=Echeneis naucrates TaxID=173247 RepID=A0A665X1B0_ECHNA|nr:neural proliferation differentiation and control protein 1-like [Echeneis naucrates]
MLPLSSPRSGRQPGAWPPPPLLLSAAVLLCVVSLGAGLPAGRKCPHLIDCAKEGRHFCCMERRRHHQHGTYHPELDEEIDYLQSVIKKQEVSDIKQQNRPFVATSQADVQKGMTNAYKHRQKSQPHPLSGSLHASTTTPGPTGTALPNTMTTKPRNTEADGRAGPIVAPVPRNDRIIVIIISLCVAVGAIAVILATACFIKLQNESHLAQKVDYPAFRGQGASAASATGAVMGDKTLAQSAQMYHYQHQKQQMLSMGNHKPEQKINDTEVTSDEEEVGGDFTVYECPGLAPTGEMEVKNPLFDDSTLQFQGNPK